MITQEDLITIGTLRRAHGLNGELQCSLDNDYFTETDPQIVVLSISQTYIPFRVLDWRTKGADLLLQLRGIDTEATAIHLVGTKVSILRSDLPNDMEVAADWESMIGYTVVDTVLGYMGKIREVDTSTINTLIQLEDGRIFPIHPDFVEQLNVNTQTMTIRLPEGILEI